MVWVTGGSSWLPWESTYCVPDSETGAGVGPRSHRPGPEGWAPSVGCSPARREELGFTDPKPKDQESPITGNKEYDQ